jgi:hypothetical protein
MPYWGFGDDTGKSCSQCKKNIVPSRFIAACINGHMEDFPYKWWVHDGDYSQCPAADKNDKLKITFSDETGGLESIVITCTACGKSRSMAGSLGKDALRGYRCHGKRPWIGMKPDHNDPVKCDAPMPSLQRGHPMSIFLRPQVHLQFLPGAVALIRNRALLGQSLLFLDANPTEDSLRAAVKLKFDDLLKLGTYSLDDIIREIRKRKNEEGNSEEYTKQDLYEDEYQVFCLGDYEQPDDYQFRIESVDVPEILSEYIDDVVMVKRLREVLALRGFRRISPEKPSADDDQFKGYHYVCGLCPFERNTP